MRAHPYRSTNDLPEQLRRLLIRVLVVFFLVTPLILLALGGSFGQVDYLAVSVIVLGVWYGVPLALRHRRGRAEQQSP